MSVELASEREREAWDQFVVASPDNSFLQSWAWGEVQRSFGLTVWRLFSRQRNQLTGAALVVSRNLPTGQRWLYVPRGPVFAAAATDTTSLYENIIELAREQRALFVRVEPRFAPHSGAARDKSGASAWRKALKDVQPRHTRIVDLDRSAEELLAAMHHKTRYNIRLGQKRGVTVRFSREAGDVELFLRLARDVAARGEFRFHPDEYYRALMTVLGGSGHGGAYAELALAEHEGDVLAAHILISFGTTVTYAHGASSSRKRELMAPHLLQWESIQRSQKRGFAHYDFFGVAPPPAGESASASHPWAGITRFKEGFGGRTVSYAGAWDLVLSQPGYFLYTLAHKLKP